MDSVAVDVVFAAEANCSDRDRAETVLVSALVSARGPRRWNASLERWRLLVDVSSGTPGIRSADAEIRDDRGDLVAKRSVRDKTAGNCIALARAVGAWAQIVLDDELQRASDTGSRASAELPERNDGALASSISTRPERSEPETLSLDAPSPAGPSNGSFELGAMFALSGAIGAGAMFGASPFVAYSFAERWNVRPSLTWASSISDSASDPSLRATIAALGGRVDICRRFAGNYLERSGLEIDACAGGDVLHMWSDAGAGQRASIGPSAILRGEVGRGFSLEFRSLVGLAFSRGSLDPEVVAIVAAGELGGSVRFQ